MAEFEVNISPENRVYAKPRLITDNTMHYCPGCSHGVVHKLIAEVLEELNLEHDAIGVSPVGCSVFAYNYIDIDWAEAAHGRAAAVASAMKRLRPDKLVFTYQGDGMTGGQMAPTTLLGMKTATTPAGRDPKLNGYPYKIADMVKLLDGVRYVTRQSVHTPASVRKAKKAIKKAFSNSMEEKGLSFVEIVATCSSGWKMSPAEANNWMSEHMFEAYPLGDLKDL